MSDIVDVKLGCYRLQDGDTVTTIYPQTDLGRMFVKDNFSGAAASFDASVSVRADMDDLATALKMQGLRVGLR